MSKSKKRRYGEKVFESDKKCDTSGDIHIQRIQKNLDRMGENKDAEICNRFKADVMSWMTRARVVKNGRETQI